MMQQCSTLVSITFTSLAAGVTNLLKGSTLTKTFRINQWFRIHGSEVKGQRHDNAWHWSQETGQVCYKSTRYDQLQQPATTLVLTLAHELEDLFSFLSSMATWAKLYETQSMLGESASSSSTTPPHPEYPTSAQSLWLAEIFEGKVKESSLAVGRAKKDIFFAGAALSERSEIRRGFCLAWWEKRRLRTASELFGGDQFRLCLSIHRKYLIFDSSGCFCKENQFDVESI